MRRFDNWSCGLIFLGSSLAYFFKDTPLCILLFGCGIVAVADCATEAICDAILNGDGK